MQATLERLRARREERGDEGGFTLIELLIVIVILGILAAIVVFAVQNLTSSSAQSACKSDLKNVETAAEAYKAQMGNYPLGGMTAATVTGAGNTPVAPAAPPANGTDSDPNNNTINAASAEKTTAGVASGGELLTGSWHTTSGTTAAPGVGKDATGNDTVNAQAPSRTDVGPWLKDVPSNGNHYTIWLANDGTGKITVGTGTVTVAPTATDCSAVS